MTGLDQRGGAGARFDHSRMPQPFVEALTLQDIKSIESANYGPSAQNQSLRLAASCSFNAASLAKGEFGSIARSRS
ncbi:MAG TPA: hypothetical protein VFK01_08560, partial [Bradyrhizobium sp.]|nr:hypothetical protein [Bradyrhizobium sp.]